MKYVALVSRLLLGLMFTVFGLNGFLQFIPQPPPSGAALQFFTVITTTHYAALIFGTQLVAGLLLLAGRYVPLALLLLAPVIANILWFHITMSPATIALGLVATVLWFIVALDARAHFGPILEPTVRRTSA